MNNVQGNNVQGGDMLPNNNDNVGSLGKVIKALAEITKDVGALSHSIKIINFSSLLMYRNFPKPFLMNTYASLVRVKEFCDSTRFLESINYFLGSKSKSDFLSDTRAVREMSLPSQAMADAGSGHYLRIVSSALFLGVGVLNAVKWIEDRGAFNLSKIASQYGSVPVFGLAFKTISLSSFMKWGAIIGFSASFLDSLNSISAERIPEGLGKRSLINMAHCASELALIALSSYLTAPYASYIFLTCGIVAGSAGLCKFLVYREYPEKVRDHAVGVENFTYQYPQ